MKFWKQATLTIGTACFSFAVLYNVFSPVIATLLMSVLALHEFAHFMAAKYFNLDPRLPLFAPFFIVTFGATYIGKSFDEIQGMVIAAAGPIAGIMASTAIMSVSFLMGNPVVSTIAGSLLIGEILNLSLGFDSAKIRKGLKSLKKQYSFTSQLVFS